MLQQLTDIPRHLLLTILGAVMGAAINWGIYSWTYFLKRSISPWQTPDPESSPRQSLDYVPVVGWIGMRRDANVHGKWFWIRPFLIEIVWMIGLPWFFSWQAAGGLTGGVLPPATWAEIWFWSHSILIALMFIATFIDFDEKMIPDWVTVPGTLFALGMAAAATSSRLPEVVGGQLAGPGVDLIHYNSPLALGTFFPELAGLIVALAIFSVWAFALIPKFVTLQLGLVGSFRFMMASILRPKRKTSCKVRTQTRGPRPLTKTLFAIWIAGMILIPVAWKMLPMANWLSLYTAVIGLGVGGGIIWLLRIVAGFAMGQEAMGFGDVTLMAMIGAFIGWQASLIVFVFAPFAALLVVFAAFIVTRKNELAFGPYLCVSALFLLLYWHGTWNHASVGVFGLGWKWIAAILIGCILPMIVLLPMMRWLRIMLLGDTYEEEEDAEQA